MIADALAWGDAPEVARRFALARVAVRDRVLRPALSWNEAIDALGFGPYGSGRGPDEDEAREIELALGELGYAPLRGEWRARRRVWYQPGAEPAEPVYSPAARS